MHTMVASMGHCCASTLRHMITLRGFVTVVALMSAAPGGLTLFGLGIASASPGASCHGQPATVVGSNRSDTYLDQEDSDNPNPRLRNHDVVVLGGGRDTVYLSGEATSLTICGGSGNDRLIVNGANFGKDYFYGQSGDDTLGNGADPDELQPKAWMTLSGGPGRDALYGSFLRDRLLGDGGNDIAEGGEGPDRFGMGSGDDRADGQEGKDEIDGGTGNDRCRAEIKRRCER